MFARLPPFGEWQLKMTAKWPAGVPVPTAARLSMTIKHTPCGQTHDLAAVFQPRSVGFFCGGVDFEARASELPRAPPKVDVPLVAAISLLALAAAVAVAYTARVRGCRLHQRPTATAAVAVARDATARS